MACLPYASRCVVCVLLMRCVVCVASYALRFIEALRRVAFRFASALRCDVASAFRSILRRVSYCVQGVSRIALRVSLRRCVLRFISYCVEVVALYCVSCFVFRSGRGVSLRCCDVAFRRCVLRFVVVCCVVALRCRLSS